MKYVDEFRNKNLIHKIAKEIEAIAPGRKINIMEVCGTHTQSFYRFGVNKLLPSNIRLISGPGCPVCVSHQNYIDSAIALAKDKNNIIVTFGDMLRIPGSKKSLIQMRAEGSDIRVVYSPYESLSLARLNPNKKVIFLAVGFETTIPTIALSMLLAKKEKIKNISFLCALKLIPPAMEFLLKDKRLNLSGFLCPGHVSTIIGTRPYEFIPKKYHIPRCVAGFEPLDIIEGIYILLKQISSDKPEVANQYMRIVHKEGNIKAKRIINKVFTPTDAFWRGLGKIPKSGLKIKKEFLNFDAQKVFRIGLAASDPYLSGRQERPATKCRCADILKGLISPRECPLFAKACSPEKPIGPCMVSQEGACNAYYRFH